MSHIQRKRRRNSNEWQQLSDSDSNDEEHKVGNADEDSERLPVKVRAVDEQNGPRPMPSKPNERLRRFSLSAPPKRKRIIDVICDDGKIITESELNELCKFRYSENDLIYKAVRNRKPAVCEDIPIIFNWPNRQKQHRFDQTKNSQHRHNSK
ncbi:hypothetical protein GJ496_011488 [Pomphorhynchus laevis]|nr:hypothetical protein GJ496_011488 [Pomphorhynchus laevis]